MLLASATRLPTCCFATGNFSSASAATMRSVSFARGGNRFLTLSAGYLGSLLIGMAVIVTAVRTRADRLMLALLGAMVLGATILYIRAPFAMLFGIATGAVMIAGARWLPRDLTDLLLRVIGLTSMIYVPYDIFSDTIARSHLDSDARILATEIGGPTLFWGALWLILSLAAIAWCLRRGLGPDSNLRRQST